MSDAILALDNVCKVFDGADHVRALDGVCLDIGRTERIAIMGRDEDHDREPYRGHAIQYLGAKAVITVSGTDVSGSYNKTFTRKGLTLDVGPVSLSGGYKLWSARVTAMDGDPPGNDTTVQTATPPGTKCA